MQEFGFICDKKSAATTVAHNKTRMFRLTQKRWNFMGGGNRFPRLIATVFFVLLFAAIPLFPAIQSTFAATFNSTNVNSEAALNTALAQGTTGDTINITITASFTITTQKNITGRIINMTSDATQRTLTRDAALGVNTMFVLNNGTTMTVTNLTIDGSKSTLTTTANRGLAFYVGSSTAGVVATLNLGDGVIVQNCASSSAAGGAIEVQVGSFLNVYGTAIVQNNEIPAATGSGGGIGGWGTIAIYGNAQIIDNYSAANAGGVYISAAGSLTLSGNAKISGNTANNGGGVYVWSNTAGSTATFTMNGGEVSNNSAITNGNGIYIVTGVNNASARFYMSAGTIDNNYTSSASTVTGTVNGGGLYAGGGTVVSITGGTINSNNIGGVAGNGRGAGICFYGSSTVTTPASQWSISGATISNNSAYYGGGVAVISAGYDNITVSGGTQFIGNHSTSAGAGFRFDGSGTATVNGVTFNGNVGGWGGGIALGGPGTTGTTTLNVSNSTFTNNSTYATPVNPDVGGGAIGVNPAITDLSVSVANSTFTGNSSQGYGGAIWVSYPQLPQLNVDSASTFSGNVAANGFFDIASADIPMYNSLIHATAWSQNAQYGYNNFDIAYDQTTPQFLVQFNTNGGNTISDQLVPTGETATRPAKPTRSGYTFDGWFSDSGLTTPYDFSTPVTANIMLYAKWTAGDETLSLSSCSSVDIDVDPGYMSSGSCDVNVNTNSYYGYTLTMQTNGSNLERSSGGQTIPSTSGTIASPSGLSGASSAWGFRMDGLGGFGSGPTTVEDGVFNSAYTWAAAPTTETTLRTTGVATSSGGDDTTVWFGVATTPGQLYGSYVQTVTWTAVANL